ncbi:uncharacterized protein LOC135484137 isoform X1 [Lineus longissimus]|uniref:uncharacterized protein LOC135484137 isoform X1 n=1 Tax=Lineus longissimus TaxID=88925 RepID=UPI00315D56D2
MGCYQGKAVSVQSHSSNGAVNGTRRKKKEEDPELQINLDPRAPLNARQIFKLQKSWKAIKRNMQMAGIEMFIGLLIGLRKNLMEKAAFSGYDNMSGEIDHGNSLFRSRADLKTLFKGFSEMDGEDELRESSALEAHATLVMGVFDEAIQNIEKVDYVFQLLEKVGRAHQRFPGFTGDLFWNMEKPFMHSVRITLGDRYNDSIEMVYHRTISFLLTNLERAFKNEKMDKL